MADCVPYPEHEKLRALEGANDTVGDFITWLRDSGYVIARYGRPYEVFAHVDFSVLLEELEEDDQEETDDYLRLTKMRRDAVRKVELQVEDWVWLRELAVRYDVVKWRTDYNSPGTRDPLAVDYWSLPHPEDPTRPWDEQRTNEEALWDPMPRTEQLLAEYFEIDQQKLSEEKDQMLRDLRAVNAT